MLHLSQRGACPETANARCMSYTAVKRHNCTLEHESRHRQGGFVPPGVKAKTSCSLSSSVCWLFSRRAHSPRVGVRTGHNSWHCSTMVRQSSSTSISTPGQVFLLARRQFPLSPRAPFSFPLFWRLSVHFERHLTRRSKKRPKDYPDYKTGIQ